MRFSADTVRGRALLERDSDLKEECQPQANVIRDAGWAGDGSELRGVCKNPGEPGDFKI